MTPMYERTLTESEWTTKDVDEPRVMAMYRALGGGEHDVILGVVPLVPQSKARPKFGKSRAYNPGDCTRAEAATGWYLKKMRTGDPLTGNVAVCCIFYRPNAQRIDTDNLLKHVCDAATGVLWVDDSQVTAITAVLELDAENPRTVIAIGDHVSSLRRGTDSDAWRECEVCGKRFFTKRGRLAQPTCSVACGTSRKGYTPLTEPVPCERCGKMFRRRGSEQKLCSQACRLAGVAERNKRESGKWMAARKIPKPTCKDCGKELSNRTAKQCRDCWRNEQPARRGAVAYSPNSRRHLKSAGG